MDSSSDDETPFTFPVQVVVRKYRPHDWEEPTPDLDLSFQPVTIHLPLSSTGSPSTMDTFCHDLALALQNVVSPENPHHSPDGLFEGGGAWPTAACLHYRPGCTMADSKWINKEGLADRMEFLRSASRHTPGWVTLEIFVEDGQWGERMAAEGSREGERTEKEEDGGDCDTKGV